MDSPILDTSDSPQLLEGTQAVPAAARARLLEPFTYLTQHPGKGIRPRLIEAFNTWLQVPPAKLAVIEGLVEELHTASLLIDDIEDNSKMRRGIPAAHLVFGVPTCINAANYVYFLAMRRGLELGGEPVCRILCDELVNLHVGQGLDIAWREAGEVPTETQYRDMVVNKTGGLFRLALRLMCAFADQAEHAPRLPAYLRLASSLGLIYQITDDYINLKSAAYHRNKSFCEDITEGKMSMPLVHHCRTKAPGDTRVLSILKQRTEDPALKRYAVRCLEETGSFKYTRDLLAGLEADLAAQIQGLGGNAPLEAIVAQVAGQREGEVGTHPPQDEG
jgi:geranylgeranyl diphosphate synthase type 3